MQICFVSQIDPERFTEYRDRHENVWPSMLNALQEAGWTDYRLYASPVTGTLVGVANVDSLSAVTKRMQDHAVNAAWQEYMSDLFVGAKSPEASFTELKLVFDLESQLERVTNGNAVD